jgi:hypothetical protein
MNELSKCSLASIVREGALSQSFTVTIFSICTTDTIIDSFNVFFPFVIIRSSVVGFRYTDEEEDVDFVDNYYLNYEETNYKINFVNSSNKDGTMVQQSYDAEEDYEIRRKIWKYIMSFL